MHGHVPENAVVEFSGYMKNKVNDKHLIIFQRPPKIVAQTTMQIGDPCEFEKRKERGDFESADLIKKFEQIDISVPTKKVEL